MGDANALNRDDWHARAAELRIEGRAFVDGRYVPALSGKTFAALNPATGKVLAQIASCDSADVDVAVRSARKAFESGVWARMAPADRKRILLKFSELMLTHREELALLESLNVGKPITNALNGDIPSSAGCIQWYAEAIDKLYGEADSYLQAITERTGGRVYQADSFDDTRAAFTAIADELRNQYVIGYYPANGRRDGKYHKIKLELARKGVEVRARPGYRVSDQSQ